MEEFTDFGDCYGGDGGSGVFGCEECCWGLWDNEEVDLVMTCPVRFTFSLQSRLEEKTFLHCVYCGVN